MDRSYKRRVEIKVGLKRVWIQFIYFWYHSGTSNQTVGTILY